MEDEAEEIQQHLRREDLGRAGGIVIRGDLDQIHADHLMAPRDRLQGVYYAATSHDEDQPVHLKVADTNICVTRCVEEYDNPCTRFCPAGVYEIVSDDAGKRLQINAANCVHCKTCDIKDPTQNIVWVAPQGGGGPNYQNL